VQLLGDLPAGVAGHPVLLVDDIVDTRRSIAYAAAALHRCGIGELWTCALIDKPQRRQIEIAIDFVGFSVPDCSSSATAPITPRSIAICPISALSNDRASAGTAAPRLRGEGRHRREHHEREQEMTPGAVAKLTRSWSLLDPVRARPKLYRDAG